MTYTSDMTAEAQGQLIYVVEDDAEIARLIVHALKSFGFFVEVFGQAGSVLRRLPCEKPDLFVVDLGLPDMDGMNLVRQIRSVSNAGVLILTVRSHTIDRVMGLELGGDDYMAKPFEPRELVARVRSILRRRSSLGGDAKSQRRYASFLGWTLDCSANVLRAAEGGEHLLGTAEAQVLRSFIERPHQILTREQLVGSRDLSPQDRSIDVRISRLRRRIEADPQHPKVIKTVYGAGYMFAAHVTWS
jgi:two-component system OmpR family response regulator